MLLYIIHLLKTQYVTIKIYTQKSRNQQTFPAFPKFKKKKSPSKKGPHSYKTGKIPYPNSRTHTHTISLDARSGCNGGPH